MALADIERARDAIMSLGVIRVQCAVCSVRSVVCFLQSEVWS